MIRLLLACVAVTNALPDPKKGDESPVHRCQAEAQCERLQAVKHPASNRKQILAGLRKNGFAVVRGGDASGFFGSEATLDAAQAGAESALEQLHEEYDAQLFTQAKYSRLRLPPAPWLYKSLDGRVARGARETTRFQYREGYSCAYLYAWAPRLVPASDSAFDPAPVCLRGRHTSGHLNMPLLGHRAPFNAPPFRTQHGGTRRPDITDKR